ncbi:MAG: hypothetical protein IJJ64_01015 [Butyrivibrio sp.]|nr:hypothetical protein [Butyrivibrio sp.]
MDKYDISQPVRLKKGVYKLNAERNFDYQLNRVINWDGGRIEDVQPIANRIRTSEDWKRELIALGDRAMQENRIQNAIAYYRMSEFFILYDLEPVADKITRHMLIVGANQDHFIDYRLIGREINMLKNVKSLTFRLFTDKEDAQNHCNVGNGKIVLDTICGWIEQIDREAAE